MLLTKAMMAKQTIQSNKNQQESDPKKPMPLTRAMMAKNQTETRTTFTTSPLRVIPPECWKKN
jgi:hypothetical protein